MKVIRRVYIYLVAFIGLMVMLAGAANLLSLLLGELFGANTELLTSGTYLRERFSSSGAMLMVGAVVWAIHWWLAQRSVATPTPGAPEAQEERRSVLRKLMIYGVLITAVGAIVLAVSDFIRNGLLEWVAPDWQVLRETVSGTVAALVVYGLGWLYYWRVRLDDNAIVPEEGRAATVRRWYFYLVSFVTLSIAVFNLSELARYIWRVATGAESVIVPADSWMGWPIAENVAWLLSAGACWLLHWSAVQRMTAAAREERHSTLRRVYVYGILLQTVSVTLASVAFFVYNLLRVFWGTDPVAGTGDSLLTAAGVPLMTALVYGVVWAYHWYVVHQEMALVAYEPALQRSLRLLYYSLVSLVSLAMLAGGLANLLNLLIDFSLSGTQYGYVTGQAWGDEISRVATLVVIGGGVWAFMWLRLQGWALAPDGAEDRRSIVRRVYLYLVLFAGIITVLISGATLIYQLLRNFGEMSAAALIMESSWPLAAGITGGVLLAYHLLTLRGDQSARVSEQPPVAEIQAPAATLLLVLRATPEEMEPALTALRGALPGDTEVDTFPAVGLTPAELQSWLATRQAVPPTPPVPTPRPPEVDQLAGTTPVPA